jgi:hypothetical protein
MLRANFSTTTSNMLDVECTITLLITSVRKLSYQCYLRNKQ